LNDSVGSCNRPYETLIPFSIYILCTYSSKACKKKIWYCVQQDASSRNFPCPEVVTAVDAGKPAAVGSPTKSSQHRGNAELHVYALKVVELKQKLKSRGLETNGLKKDLRTRLLDAMLEDTGDHDETENEAEQNIGSPDKSASETTGSDDPEVPDKSASETNGIDDPEVPLPTSDGKTQYLDKGQMKETSNLDDSSKKVGDSSCGREQDMGADPGQSTIPDSDCSVGKSSQTSRDYWMNKVKPSPAPKQDNESKDDDQSHSTSRSPLRGLVKQAFKVFGTHGHSKSQPPPPDQLDDPTDDISPPSSEASNCSKISGTKVRELVSKIANNSNYQTTQNGGSALSKNLQAKKEARLARMAEIREKVRNTWISKLVFGSQN
jgi:hypothetical protein